MQPESIHTASGLLREANRCLKAELQLTVRQWEALTFVASHEAPIAMGTLTDHMDVTPAVITGIVDKLERIEALARVRSGDDRRQIRLAVTDRGQQVLANASAVLEAAA